MAKPRPLQNVFMGMFRDKGRNKVPPGMFWNIVNGLPEIHGPLSMRNGWDWASNSVTAVTGSVTRIVSGIYAIFSPTAGADPQNLFQDQNGDLFKAAADGTVTRLGAAVSMNQNPVFHGGTAVSGTTAATAAVYTGLVIFSAADGSTPKKYNGTTISNLNGSPPKARYATVYKDYTVLGNGSVSGASGDVHYPNRIWFSPPGDPDCGFSGEVVAWDTTDSWIDFSLPVVGLAATKNALLVFHETALSRIRGSTPPPDEDMINDDPWLQIGLLDAFSITQHDEYVYWCAAEGVYRTDGTIQENLCKKGGMQKFWSDTVAQATSATGFSTGVVRNWLVVSMTDKTGNRNNPNEAFMINLDTFAWIRVSSFPFRGMWSGQDGESDALYAGYADGSYTDPRPVHVDAIFDTPGEDMEDEDGTDPFLTFETGFYELGRPGLKRMKRIFTGLRFGNSAQTQNEGLLTLTTSTDMAREDYAGDTSGASATLVAGSAEYRRISFPMNRRTEGFSLKGVVSSAADAFTLYDLGIEVVFQEESKRAPLNPDDSGFSGAGQA